MPELGQHGLAVLERAAEVALGEVSEVEAVLLSVDLSSPSSWRTCART